MCSVADMISARRIVAALTAAALALSTATVSSTVAQAQDLGGLVAPSGIDVSGHQHTTLAGIDWNAVKSDGQSFAFVKATEGEGWVNSHYLGDVNAAKMAGLKVGAYHYARPAADPARQAAEFAAQLALVPGQTLPPVLDLEVSEGKSPAELVAWTRTFISELQRLTGRTPMIYTYKYFWLHEMGNTTEFSEFPLWLAAYQDQAPEPVGGWDRIAFWQRSDSGRVGGITGPVDMNIFNGTHMQLETFSAGNYIDFGGILENLVIPGVDLSGDARAVIAAILALSVGAAVAPALTEAAGGDQFTDMAKALIANDALPKAQLEEMLKNGATLSDLALLLDNSAHLSNTEVDAVEVDHAQKAAREVGVQLPQMDSGAVAAAVNRMLAGA